jgi:hypothetical protein
VTDAIVKQEIGKQPLDVGAERIARTAHTALDLLHRISQHTKQPIPLAWQPQLITPLAAIEVYPAATLTAHHINMLGYKKPDGQAARSTLLSALTEHIILPLELELMIENDNVLDAAVCILAGADFLRGITIPPFDKEVAKKEGWIWVRKPK